MDCCISVDNLTKSYRTGVGGNTRTAVSGLNLAVPAGQIRGLLGPNGAGKTTTLKSIMGFIRPTSGSVTIFGSSARDRAVHSRVGFLPEQPYFYQHLKANQMLDFYGRLCGLHGEALKSRRDELLRVVGLSDSADMRLSKFSRGMLQRLGIAQALVHDPELVILDEPASGLDPIGQKEMRDLVLALKRRGKTVFLSSHQLSEVEAVCDSVSILAKGSLRQEGTLDDLLSVTHSSTISARAKDGGPGSLESELAGLVDDIALSDGIWSIVAPNERVYDVLSVLQRHGCALESVLPRRRSLEDYFIDLVRDEPDGN